MRSSNRGRASQDEDLLQVALRLIGAETYEHQDILVVGGDHSAIEAAIATSKHERNRVTLSYRGDNFQRERERNLKLLEEAEKQGRIRILRDSRVTEILADSLKLECGGKPVEIPNHFVFILIGGESPEEFLQKIGVEIVEKVISDERHAVLQTS